MSVPVILSWKNYPPTPAQNSKIKALKGHAAKHPPLNHNGQPFSPLAPPPWSFVTETILELEFLDNGHEIPTVGDTLLWLDLCWDDIANNYNWDRTRALPLYEEFKTWTAQFNHCTKSSVLRSNYYSLLWKQK